MRKLSPVLAMGCAVLLASCASKSAPLTAGNVSKTISGTKQPDEVDQQSLEDKGVVTADLVKLQPKVNFKLPGKRSVERCLQLSADGRRVAIDYREGPAKSLVQIWELTAEPKVIAELPGGYIALSPSGKLVTASLNQDVYDVDSKKSVARLPSESLYWSHAFFRDDSILVVTSRSYEFDKQSPGRITIWNITKNADAGSFAIPDHRFEMALPAKGGKELWLFMGNKKFEVECYDLNAKKLARTVKPELDDPKTPYTSSGTWPTITSDASVLASSVFRFHIYDASTGKIVGGLPTDLWATSAGFLPGGSRYLARASNDAATKVGLAETDFIAYDWKARKALAALVGHSAGQKSPLAVASADGKTLVSVSEEGEALVYDLSSLK
jgi:WD40 repeat protein